jgi:hypothetical protein
VQRQPDLQTFRIVVGEPIDVASSSPADQLAATQLLADALEASIAAAPSQWYSFKPIWPSDPAEAVGLERRANEMAADHGPAPRAATDTAPLVVAGEAPAAPEVAPA